MEPYFKKGDKVVYSQEAIDFLKPLKKDRVGVVVCISKESTVRVTWHGTKSHPTFHPSFLRKLMPIEYLQNLSQSGEQC